MFYCCQSIVLYFKKMEKVNMNIVDHLRDPDSAEAIEQERMTQI